MSRGSDERTEIIAPTSRVTETVAGDTSTLRERGLETNLERVVLLLLPSLLLLLPL
jgi:hypothetical protein